MKGVASVNFSGKEWNHIPTQSNVIPNQANSSIATTTFILFEKTLKIKT